MGPFMAIIKRSSNEHVKCLPIIATQLWFVPKHLEIRSMDSIQERSRVLFGVQSGISIYYGNQEIILYDSPSLVPLICPLAHETPLAH